jgi:type III secretory pathway component EscT
MGDSYALLFINSSLQGNPLVAMSMFLLFLARILPIIALSPFFGARLLPHPVKIAFSICLFVIFLPQLASITTTPLTFNFVIVTYMIKEMFIGLIMGNIISLPFNIASGAGIIIDHQRGGASLMVNDPTIQNQSSPIGTMMNMILILVFFLIGGPWDVLDAISKSYEIIPPDKFISPLFFAKETPSMTMMIGMLNQVVLMTTQLSMPCILAMLMTDSFLGIANRLAPQVQITFLGMPLKSLLGLTILALGWQFLIKQMIFDAHYWIGQLNDIVSLFTYGQGAPT